MSRRKVHEVETASTDQVLAEEETPTTDLDPESVQTDAGVRKPSQDLSAGTGAPTSIKDQLIEACRRAVDVLPDHEILVREQLIAAIQRAEKQPKRREDGKPTKESHAIEMLRRPEGATVAQLMAEMNWLKHSTHGFFANLKRKRGLYVTSEKHEGGDRVYRLA